MSIVRRPATRNDLDRYLEDGGQMFHSCGAALEHSWRNGYSKYICPTCKCAWPETMLFSMSAVDVRERFGVNEYHFEDRELLGWFTDGIRKWSGLSRPGLPCPPGVTWEPFTEHLWDRER